MRPKAVLVEVLVAVLVMGAFVVWRTTEVSDIHVALTDTEKVANTAQSPNVLNSAENVSLPQQKLLANDYHVFQTFNNCAMAALSMMLSYFDVRVSQEVLAAELRPNNNLKGINDNKSTPPPELTVKAEEYGLVTYVRPNGDIDMLKRLVNLGVPVLVRTLLHTYEDYAHYRVVKGYDDAAHVIIQDDGYEGKNLRISYEKWNMLWQPFNYVYIVFAPPERRAAVEAILGDERDVRVAWQNAKERGIAEITAKPEDRNAQFNLSVAEYHLGNYRASVAAFEKVESYLTTHTIWYQLEPIRAYFELGNYERVFKLSQKIFEAKNPAETQLYILRGRSYEKLGNLNAARIAYEKAFLYNKNSKEAKDALLAIGGNLQSIQTPIPTRREFSIVPAMGP